ncbi:DUF488 family protein [Sutcliffiella horikoshii]|uniref:DUF488 domain-containing protein n=1 Tax=Sutcliffiella horikoshii TaxID=79883 RepID=UPI001CBE7979|nr:DUF488 domain-containing protein [Sutcliffiella horikoshii]UAL47970.1 DUF488 domain-containing protein [Sutcliffiella horikoshii]
MGETINTIGFAKKSLRQFIKLLKEAGVTKVVDTRLNNTSQLSGFAKKQDLEYILELVDIKYIHTPTLAPSDYILKSYKKKEMTWDEYEIEYNELIEKRKILPLVKKLIEDDNVCFLCSEHQHTHCHRRILTDYIQSSLKNIKVNHL